MRETWVEVDSDAGTAAIPRHPARQFPGVLLQGDTLHRLGQSAESALKLLEPGSEAHGEVEALRDALLALKRHYKSTLDAHDLPLPF